MNLICIKLGHGVEHTNLFGWNFRPSGYASDPNYATLLLVLCCVCVLKMNEKKIVKAIMILPFLLGMAMSFSKTIILASACSIVYVVFQKYVIKNKKITCIFNYLLFASLILASMFAPFISILDSILPKTMTIRLVMWKDAVNLFIKSPIIGNGITSFRSYFNINHWYVQAHNTYLQIISEMGIIGILMFCLLMKKVLKESINNGINFFVNILFLVFMINFETIMLQFFVFVVLLLPIEDKIKNNINSKKALFFINSLGNGGAERVCINMSNELVKKGFEVDFILLNKGNNEYSLNENINILDLKISSKNKIIKILKILFSIFKVNGYIEERQLDGDYSLITSHLPMSNVVTRLSSVRNKSLYVFHLNMSHYGNKNSFIFKCMIHFMFFKKKIVSVSEGVRMECINDYNMDEKYIRTIYNPIDIEEISNKMNDNIEVKEKYFLQVGRLTKQKRQDRMIEVFYRGGFYKNYKLLLCGTGELLDDYQDLVKKFGIEDSVVFLGWQNNSYKWMKNAELLICTSDNEAFPMTLIEALACKTKVVSSNCKFGPNEILIDEFSNFLVETDNIDDYIEKINKALISYPKQENSVLKKCIASNVIDNYILFAKEEND